jgi:hypothetical protein
MEKTDNLDLCGLVMVVVVAWLLTADIPLRCRFTNAGERMILQLTRRPYGAWRSGGGLTLMTLPNLPQWDPTSKTEFLWMISTPSKHVCPPLSIF